MSFRLERSTLVSSPRLSDTFSFASTSATTPILGFRTWTNTKMENTSQSTCVFVVGRVTRLLRLVKRKSLRELGWKRWKELEESWKHVIPRLAQFTLEIQRRLSNEIAVCVSVVSYSDLIEKESQGESRERERERGGEGVRAGSTVSRRHKYKIEFPLSFGALHKVVHGLFFGETTAVLRERNRDKRHRAKSSSVESRRSNESLA